MEVEVNLHFSCCVCARGVSAKVKCSGKGLEAGPRTVAAVTIPCPHCELLNQLYFEPSGAIRAVAPYEVPHRIPQPSAN
jgi:hypothetical protein